MSDNSSVSFGPVEPGLNFGVIEKQIAAYYAVFSLRALTKREIRYKLEMELTSLDFINDELRELLRDVEARAMHVSNRLDNLV